MTWLEHTINCLMYNSIIVKSKGLWALQKGIWATCDKDSQQQRQKLNRAHLNIC